MSDEFENEYDDPVWQYVMVTKLQQYIPAAREFWEKIEDIHVFGTGVYPVTEKHVSCEIPPGMMYRVTNTAVRSPIKGIQVFPFVPTAYLQISNVAGGVLRMVSRVCADNQFHIDEFTIVEKHNLPSTYHQGQFVAFVPTDILNGSKQLGRWVYLKMEEIIWILDGKLTPKVKEKLIKYFN